MNTYINEEVDYFFIQKLFDIGFNNGRGWKSHYFRNAQEVFEKNYKPLGKWKQNLTDSRKYGIYGDDDVWSWMNRINSHPNCCLSFYRWAIKYNSNIFTEFGNPLYHEYNAKKMWEFINEFFELIFTTKTTHKYLRELKVKCQKSWNNGNISVIAIILSLRETFGEITDLGYTFDYGDGGDMGGIDFSFKLPNGEVKSIQIKSGSFFNVDDTYFVKGSPNDLKYNVDFFGYANVDSWNNSTSVIIFNKTNDLVKDGKNIIVKEENIKYKKIYHMPIPEKLNELLIFCGKKNIEFTIIREEKLNSVNFDSQEKKVTLIISDIEDSNLETLIDKKIKELKELFK